MGVHRKFGLPVREAKEALVIPLLQVDIDEAQKTKPKNVNDTENFLSCVIAQGVTRVCGAERVAILRGCAYVAFPGDKHTKRYMINRKSRDVLERWDRGEPIIEGVELSLRPPKKGETRASSVARKARNIQENKGKKRPLTNRRPRTSDPLHNVVRNGNLVRWA